MLQQQATPRHKTPPAACAGTPAAVVGRTRAVLRPHRPQASAGRVQAQGARRTAAPTHEQHTSRHTQRHPISATHKLRHTPWTRRVHTRRLRAHNRGRSSSHVQPHTTPAHGRADHARKSHQRGDTHKSATPRARRGPARAPARVRTLAPDSTLEGWGRNVTRRCMRRPSTKPFETPGGSTNASYCSSTCKSEARARARRTPGPRVRHRQTRAPAQHITGQPAVPLATRASQPAARPARARRPRPAAPHRPRAPRAHSPSSQPCLRLRRGTAPRAALKACLNAGIFVCSVRRPRLGSSD